MKTIGIYLFSTLVLLRIHQEIDDKELVLAF